MTIENNIIKLTKELVRIHSDDFDWSEITIPDFTTAKNGYQVNFSRDAIIYMSEISEIIFNNLDKNKFKIELKRIKSFMRSVIANLFSSGKLDQYTTTSSIEEKRNIERELKEHIENLIVLNSKELTHHYSAQTVFSHHHPLICIGPVQISNRKDWIKNNDYSTDIMDTHYNQKKLNYKWKEQVIKLLIHEKTKTSSLADDIYDFIKTGNSVISIKLNNIETELSTKLSRLISKTTLDALSLFFGSKDCFLQNTLYEDRLPPVGYKKIKSRNGYLTIAGFTLSNRIPHRSANDFIQELQKFDNIIKGFSFIIFGLSDPDSHPYPQLANRWATALEWYAEAQRETNESIALAKLGTCLDILSCGGKKVGITNLICHLLRVDENHPVTVGKQDIKLKDVIAKLYNYGRSQILHGNHVDRLQTFEKECSAASYFARIALLEIADRLQHYQGEDSPTAFRTISPYT